MRIHTTLYKNNICKGGRQLHTKITYDNNELLGNSLFNVVLNTNTDLLKSVMKQLDFNSREQVKKNTIINVQNGVLVGDEYQYVDLGNYIVKESKYDVETKSYTHECYDMMLKTMIDYNLKNITYPITLREYIIAIANACGLTFNNSQDKFANYNINITQDYFSVYNYTFRDVLDFIAEIIGGWFIINEDDELQIKYPTETNETFNGDFLKDKNIAFGKKYGPINKVVFSRGNGTDNIYRDDKESILANGLCEIKIKDNPFLEGDDRDSFIQDVFDKIKGLEFYTLDIVSTGVTYLEVGDLYSFKIDNKIINALKSGVTKSGLTKSQSFKDDKYKCLLLNSEINITGGLSESIYCDEPSVTVTDYKTASVSDKTVKNAVFQTNKNAANILLKVNYDDVVSAINLSPERTKIDSKKLDVDAIASFTNSKLAESGSTVINGDNITTGVLQSENYIEDVSGTKFDLNDGTISSPNFNVDSEGNIDVAGYIESNRGLLTTKIIESAIISYQFMGSNAILPMGFSTNHTKDSLQFQFEIPDNFEITEAYIILNHMPVRYAQEDIIGYTRNLKLYKGNNIRGTRLEINYMDFSTKYNGDYEEIQNAFGTTGFTGSLAMSSYKKTEVELKEHIVNGTNILKIETSDNIPSAYEDILKQTGACKGTLYINGYTKKEGNI